MMRLAREAEEEALPVPVEAVVLPVEVVVLPVEVVVEEEVEQEVEEQSTEAAGEGGTPDGPVEDLQMRTLLPCMSCDQTFMRARLLYDHTRSHHGEPANCKECGKAFHSKRAMLRHFGDVHGDPRGVCQFCGHGFTKKSNLDKHVKSCKAGPAREPRVEPAVRRRAPAPTRQHACDLCDFCSPSRRLFLQHRLKDHPEDKVHACGQCDKAFVLKSTLTQHISRSHSDWTFPCMGEVVDGAVVRLGCGKVFNRHDTLLRHKKTCGRPKVQKPFVELSRWQKARRADRKATEILSTLDQLDPEERRKVLLRMVKKDPDILDQLDRNPLTMDTILEVILARFHTV
jgi:DNA-directed RNA polymerase subunit M/transcription elongation factor TFIIS